MIPKQTCVGDLGESQKQKMVGACRRGRGARGVMAGD
jgi:hypothetical protein